MPIEGFFVSGECVKSESNPDAGFTNEASHEAINADFVKIHKEIAERGGQLVATYTIETHDAPPNSEGSIAYNQGVHIIVDFPDARQ